MLHMSYEGSFETLLLMVRIEFVTIPELCNSLTIYLEQKILFVPDNGDGQGLILVSFEERMGNPRDI